MRIGIYNNYFKYTNNSQVCKYRQAEPAEKDSFSFKGEQVFTLRKEQGQWLLGKLLSESTNIEQEFSALPHIDSGFKYESGRKRELAKKTVNCSP